VVYFDVMNREDIDQICFFEEKEFAIGGVVIVGARRIESGRAQIFLSESKNEADLLKKGLNAYEQVDPESSLKFDGAVVLFATPGFSSKRQAAFHHVADMLERLKKFSVIAAEGITAEDMKYLGERTSYVVGDKKKTQVQKKAQPESRI